MNTHGMIRDIEYLGSNGAGTWINLLNTTLADLQKTASDSIELSVTGYLKRVYEWPVLAQVYTNSGWLFRLAQYPELRYWYNNTQSYDYVNKLCKYTVYYGKSGEGSKLLVDGEIVFESTSTPTFNGLHPTYQGSGIFSANAGSFVAKGYGRFYGLVCKKNGVNVMDLVPVRVGQVGYAYDKVTKTLYPSSGTGSFVLGPDVAKPVMGLWGMKQITYVPSDYVTDGIVAWYDGEWNAGWGKHDSSATTWKDLSGNNLDLTVDLTYGTWNQNRLIPKGGGVPAYKADGQTALNSLGVVPKAAEVVFYSPYQNDFRVIINISYVGNRYNCVAGMYNTVGWGGALRSAAKGVAMACSTSLSYSYINGVSAGNIVYTNNISSAGRSASELSICGVRQNLQGGINYQFNGSVYCVRLYNRALSPAEIAHNYQIDKARFNLP